MDLFILGIVTGVCIGYILFKCRIYIENNCLICKGIDEESKDNLYKFIKDCIERKTDD